MLSVALGYVYLFPSAHRLFKRERKKKKEEDRKVFHDAFLQYSLEGQMLILNQLLPRQSLDSYHLLK